LTALGLTLLVIGAVVAAAEAHYPAHGVAGGLGVLAMAAGAVLAISGLGGGLLAAVLVGLTLAAAGPAAVYAVVRQGRRVRTRRVRTGAEGMLGQIGTVRAWNGSSGKVELAGSLWRASESARAEPADQPPQPGDRVVVERVQGLTLSVRLAEEWELL
jgi:membrane-bound serine protease (ClpP class)